MQITGKTTQPYFAFWYDGERRRKAVVHIMYPPHEDPRGSVLDDFIIAGLKEQFPNTPKVVLLGSVAMWGAEREIAMGDGSISQVVLHQDQWRVVS